MIPDSELTFGTVGLYILAYLLMAVAFIGIIVLIIKTIAWIINYVSTRKTVDYIIPFSEFHLYYSIEKNDPDSLDRWTLYSDYVLFKDKTEYNRYFLFYDSYYVGFSFVDTIIYQLWQAAGKHLVTVKNKTKKAQDISRKLQSIYWESD